MAFKHGIAMVSLVGILCFVLGAVVVERIRPGAANRMHSAANPFDDSPDGKLRGKNVNILGKTEEKIGSSSFASMQNGDSKIPEKNTRAPPFPVRSRHKVVLLESGDGGALPLLSASVVADIIGPISHVSVRQSFRNVGNSLARDTVYRFPINERSAVSSFSATIAGKEIVGIVKPKEEARRTYMRAVQAGAKAALGEADRGDVFTISIGNVPAGAAVEVKLTYVADLPAEGSNGFRFSLPAELSKRYGAGEESHTGAAPMRANAAQAPKETPLDISVKLRMPSRIHSVESATHPIRFTAATDDLRAGAVTLAAQGNTAGEGEFVMVVQVDEAGAELAVATAPDLTRSDKSTPDPATAAMVTFVPDIVTAREKLHVPADGSLDGVLHLFIVVDRSGSMRGTKMSQVRDALKILLRSLPTGAKFNIVSFGSEMDSLWPLSETRVLSDASLEEATEHVASMDANYGGTEILTPVRVVAAEAAKIHVRKGLTKVLFLTDGQVWNTAEVIETVAQSRAATGSTWFTVGIGSDSSHELVSSMASAGGGAAEFVTNRERVDAKMMRHMYRIITVPIAVTASWSRSGVAVCEPGKGAIGPSWALRPAMVRPDDRLTFFVLCEGSHVPDQVTLTFTSPASHVRYIKKIAVFKDSAVLGDSLEKIGARGMTRAVLECDASGWWHGGAPCASPAETRAAVTEVGVRFGIATRFTSFVAVEKSELERQASEEVGDFKETVDAPDVVGPRGESGIVGPRGERGMMKSSRMYAAKHKAGNARGPTGLGGMKKSSRMHEAKRKAENEMDALVPGDQKLEVASQMLQFGEKRAQMESKASQEEMIDDDDAQAEVNRLADEVARARSEERSSYEGGAAMMSVEEEAKEEAEESAREKVQMSAEEIEDTKDADEEGTEQVGCDATGIVIFQKAAGFWEPGEAFTKLIMRKIPRDAQASVLRLLKKGKWWATAVAIAVLRLTCADQQMVTGLIERKAITWMRTSQEENNDPEEAIAEVLKAIKKG